MPKTKNHLIKNKKDYLYVAISVTIIIFCILLIGRIGLAGQKLALFFSFIFGDFSTIILALVLGYTVAYLLFKKKVDLHHISFIGIMFIFLALLMFAHLGLYEALSMTNTTVITKTFELYKHYFKAYDISYSCGGGLVGALLVQLSCLLISRVGSILLGLAMIFIGISYLANVNIFGLIRGGKVTKIPKIMYAKVKGFIKEIHYPNFQSRAPKKISINSLEDAEGEVSFTLQNEINKEKFEEFKSYIRNNKIYCIVDSFYTSYSSSRFIIKFAHKNDDELKLLLGFFNRKGFLLKNDNEYYLDYQNQFRKLLTLKNMLIDEINNLSIPLAITVDGKKISLDISNGRFIVILGDQSSGLKTFVRSMIISILIKNIPYSDIYFYDFDNEFQCLNNSNFKYVNNEKSASIALDEAFNEYERRSEILKYFNLDNIKEVNAHIKKSNIDMDYILPEFHFLIVDFALISASLLQKIIYAIRFSIKVGITIIVAARNKSSLAKLELNKSDLVVFNINDVSTSLKLFGSDMACRLQKKGDVLLRIDNVIYHGQAPYVSNSDFDKIVSK